MSSDKTIDLVITALLAIFGLLAHLLSQKDKKAVEVTGMISGCFVAAFSGVLAYFISEAFNFEVSIAYVFAGICGWIGPQILDSMSSMVIRKIGIDL